MSLTSRPPPDRREASRACLPLFFCPRPLLRRRRPHRVYEADVGEGSYRTWAAPLVAGASLSQRTAQVAARRRPQRLARRIAVFRSPATVRGILPPLPCRAACAARAAGRCAAANPPPPTTARRFVREPARRHNCHPVAHTPSHTRGSALSAHVTRYWPEDKYCK